MHWTDALPVLTRQDLPPDYRIDQLRSDDIATVVQRLAAWYPGMRVSAERAHLDPEFYLRDCTLLGADDRPVLPLVLAHARDGLVGLITFEKNALARSIVSRVGALAPDHRRAGLALLGPLLLEGLGRALGAELAFYTATLKTRHQQVIAERAGFRLSGILPGWDRDLADGGEVKRVYEALYVKPLVDDAQLEAPAREALTQRTRALWVALFGSGLS